MLFVAHPQVLPHPCYIGSLPLRFHLQIHMTLKKTIPPAMMISPLGAIWKKRAFLTHPLRHKQLLP
jgi:hypothetical protein